MNKIILDLEVNLTSKELQEKGQEMAAAIIQYDDYEAEKKEIAKDLGDKMKDLHLKLSGLARVTRRKTEVKPVECKVELNTPETGTKRITRMDTKTIIKELPMTLAERQTNLFEESIEELQKMFNLESDEQSPEEPPAPEQPAA
jgi:hypothetical protein